MRYKTLPLVLVVLLVTCLAIVGCGPAPAEFELSNLQIPPGTVEVSEGVAISVDVTNIGGLEGSYTVVLAVDDETLTENVTLAPGATEEVTFTYTPTTEGEYTITVDELSETLVVVAPVEGWWRIPYRVVGGEMTLLISLPELGSTVAETGADFPLSTMDILINKTVADGSREFVIDGASFSVPSMHIPGVIPGIDIDLQLSLEEDATGTLCVEDGVGDVDVTSETVSGMTPETSCTFGDGTLDPAGSILVHLPLVAEATLPAIGAQETWPMDVFTTTGHSYNHVTRPGKPINDLEVEWNGLSLAEDGGPAPYVGTSGTLVAIGALLTRRIGPFEVDLQFRVVIEIEAVPGWEQE